MKRLLSGRFDSRTGAVLVARQVVTAGMVVIPALWGCADVPQAVSPSTGPGDSRAVFTAVSAGDDHTCALTTELEAVCWGGNEVGQLGDAAFYLNRPVAAQVSGGFQFSAIKTGAFHTCGVTTDYIPLCWGFNVTGQLGDGSLVKRRNVPTPVVGGLRMSALDAGGGHTCGVTLGGAAYCWGFRPDGGELIDSTIESRVPILVGGGVTFIDIGTGADHRCGTSIGSDTYCWGSGANGRLGNGVLVGDREPGVVTTDMDFRFVDGGDGHSCAITVDGSVYCWGLNVSGQLGDGSNVDRFEPTLIENFQFQQITVGGDHSCGLNEMGEAFCWGLNNFGQLGDGTGISRSVPAAVVGGIRFSSLDGGRFHTCGISVSGEIYCWGFNQRGQLGDGTIDDSLVPVSASGDGGLVGL